MVLNCASEKGLSAYRPEIREAPARPGGPQEWRVGLGAGGEDCGPEPLR